MYKILISTVRNARRILIFFNFSPHWFVFYGRQFDDTVSNTAKDEMISSRAGHIRNFLRRCANEAQRKCWWILRVAQRTTDDHLPKFEIRIFVNNSEKQETRD